MSDEHNFPQGQPPYGQQPNGASPAQGGYAQQYQQLYGQQPQYRQPEPPKKRHGIFKMGCLGLIGLFVLIAIIAAIANGGKKSSTSSPSVTPSSSAPPSSSSTTSTSASPAPSESSIQSNPSDATPSSSATSASEEPASASPATPSLDGEAGQAVSSARSYLEMGGFSKRGLIEQLSSSAGEGFPLATATQAVNSLTDVNWNEQAVKSAKSYLETSAFSCAGLKEQLSSDAGEKFTPAQAAYGAEHTKACQ